MEEKEASNGKERHHEHPEVDQLVEVINAEEAESELDAVIDDLIEENGIEKEEEEEEEVVTKFVALSSQVEEELPETVLTQAEPVVAEDVKTSNGETPDLEPSDEAVTSSSRDAEPVVAKEVKTSNGETPDLEPSEEAVAVTEAVTLSSRDVEALPGEEETKGVHLEDNSAIVTVVGSSDAVTDQSTVVTSTPIIHLSQRSVQPTSWRSCCGLFDVLRRSNG